MTDSQPPDAPYHLAQVNIARARAPLDDPRMGEFIAPARRRFIPLGGVAAELNTLMMP